MSEATLGTPPPAPAAAPPAGAPPTDAPSGQGAGTAAIDSAQAKLEEAGVDVPDQKKGESDKDYELRLSKVTRELRLARQQIAKHGDSAKELETLRSELAKAKDKRMTKREYVEMTRALSKGELQLDDDEMAALPPAVRKEIEDLKAWKEEQTREADKRNGSVQRTKEIGIVAETLKGLAESHPLMTDKHAEFVLDEWYDRYAASGKDERTRVKPDLEQVVSELHEGLVNTLVGTLQSPKARQFLLSKIPELKDLLGGHKVEMGGPQSDAQGAGRGNDPRPNANASQADTGSQPLSEEERIAQSRAAYDEYRRSARGG